MKKRRGMFNGGFEGPDGQQPSPGNTFG